MRNGIAGHGFGKEHGMGVGSAAGRMDRKGLVGRPVVLGEKGLSLVDSTKGSIAISKEVVDVVVQLGETEAALHQIESEREEYLQQAGRVFDEQVEALRMTSEKLRDRLDASLASLPCGQELSIGTVRVRRVQEQSLVPLEGTNWTGVMDRLKDGGKAEALLTSVRPNVQALAVWDERELASYGIGRTEASRLEISCTGQY